MRCKDVTDSFIQSLQVVKSTELLPNPRNPQMVILLQVMCVMLKVIR